MNADEMRWKARINRYAKEHRIAPQVALQNIMFERFLRRLAHSEYKDNFILKGGVLIAAIVGLDYRSTMDIDTTLRRFPMNEKKLAEAFQAIAARDERDDTHFQVVRVAPIRPDDDYGGLRISLRAECGRILVPFSIDVSTGDAITPHPVETDIPVLFDDLPPIRIWSYNMETVVAEKLETIISRGVLSTRPRDFYDVYILTRTCPIQTEILKRALLSTAEHRKSERNIRQWKNTLGELSCSSIQQQYWESYRGKFPYAQAIEYADLMSCLERILNSLFEE